MSNFHTLHCFALQSRTCDYTTAEIATLQALLSALELKAWDGIDGERAQTLLKESAAAADVKKGVLMKSLRAALLGRLQGPDLLTTWGLLARLGNDRQRLRRCL